MHINDDKIWSFPEVSIYADFDGHEYTSDAMRILYEAKVKELTTIIESKERLITDLQERISHLCEANQRQEQYFYEMISKINNVIPVVTKNMSDMFMLLVKKFTKAVLLKELQLDMTALSDIITNALNQVAGQGLIKVNVSPSTYGLLMSSKLSSVICIESDANLSDFDFVIKTNTGMYIHKIEDRVNDIMRMYHE